MSITVDVVPLPEEYARTTGYTTLASRERVVLAVAPEPWQLVWLPVQGVYAKVVDNALYPVVHHDRALVVFAVQPFGLDLDALAKAGVANGATFRPPPSGG